MATKRQCKKAVAIKPGLRSGKGEPMGIHVDRQRLPPLRAVNADLLACLADIVILADDYDGYETPGKLRELIDEIAALAKTRKPLPGTC